MVTVSDDEMREATRALYRAGVVAEVSGAAAVAAVLAGKLGDVSGTHLVSKASPIKGWPEWRRAGLTSAKGCPGRHLGAASLGQSAAWAASMLAGHTARVSHYRPARGLHGVGPQH